MACSSSGRELLGEALKAVLAGRGVLVCGGECAEKEGNHLDGKQHRQMRGLCAGAASRGARPPRSKCRPSFAHKTQTRSQEKKK